MDYKLQDFNLNQMYAQAYQLYRTGFQYWLDEKEQNEIEMQNARFRAMSVEEELVTTYFEPCQDMDSDSKRMQAHEIQSYLQRKVPHVKLSPISIGKVLSSKGFVQKKTNGISKWVVRERTPSEKE